ncbi:MAG: hypothetical protein HYY06_02415 [Deltaproteobacteria bacterium]|nr:hypothetical protein [Deltaproteobacteria bacterium]
MMRLQASLLALFLSTGCVDEGSIIQIPTGLEGLEVTSVQMPEVALPGTTLEIRGTGFVPEEVGTPTLWLEGMVGDRAVRIDAAVTYVSEVEMRSSLGADVIAELGIGHFEGDVTLSFVAARNGRAYRAGVQKAFEVRAVLEPAIGAVEDGAIHVNDPVLLRGGGFLEEGEGTTEAVYAGTYTTDGGAEIDAQNVVVAARLAEAHARDLAIFPFPTSVGGIEPGRFVGTVTAVNRHLDGQSLQSPPIDVTFDIGLPEIFQVDPPTASIGQILHVVGAGFVGGEDGDEVTVVRLNGVFEPVGADPVAVEDRDLVPQFASGQDLRYGILPLASESGRIVALDFNASAGVFRGTMQPIVSKGTTVVEGEARQIEFALGGVEQAVWVRFLPGFSESIRLFGLHAVEDEIRSRVLEKLERVYDGVNVEFFEDEPVEYDPAAYVLLDLGGPDPNGEGLFGYDNTPGKDVGNLRLYDHIGGSNAAGAEDGYGYGGVFIESFFYFSDHPPFTGSRPPSSPQAEPEFDRIFDPVRDEEVTAGDWPDGPRAAEVDLAIGTLSSLIGDTAAHEFGHSLGLAMPYGLPTQYHNLFDTPACLMDAGGDRPFGERAELEGFDYGRFCGDEVTYLEDVLPAD